MLFFIIVYCYKFSVSNANGHLVGCWDIEKISNIDIEQKNTGNIDIFDIFLP